MEKKKRTKVIGITVTDEEYKKLTRDLLEKSLEDENILTFSRYLRVLLKLDKE